MRIFAVFAIALLSACAGRQAVSEAEAGRALADEGKADEARARYERALALDPNIVGAHHGLGMLHLRAGDLPRAITELVREVEQHPDNDDARHNLAIAYIRLGRATDALARLAELKGPETAERSLVKAIALMHQGDLPAARDLATKVSTEQPSAFASTLVGLIDAAEGRPDDAVAALQAAIDRDPKATAPILALGLVRLRTGEGRKGVAEVQPLLQLAPKDADGPLLLGLLHLGTGNPRGAREQLDASLALDPTRAGVRNTLAVARSLDGDEKGAAEALEDELAKRPGLPVAHRNRAVLLYRSGDLEGARVAFARALTLDPADAASRKALTALDAALPPPRD